MTISAPPFVSEGSTQHTNQNIINRIMGLKDKISNSISRTRLFFRRLWNGRHTIRDLVKHKHRFIVLDTNTYKEKISFQLSGSKVFVFLGITALVLVFLTALLLAFTPLREFIPGYSNAKMTEQTYANARLVDSLEVQLQAQEELLADIQDVMLGKDPSQRHANQSTSANDSIKVKPTPYVRSKEDSLLRVEMQERGGDKNYACPLKGKITKKFNSNADFKGIVIEAGRGDKVLAIQSGVVLLTDKDSDGIFTLLLQHSNGLLSLYKGQGKLLKKSGDAVQSGEPILQLQPSQRKGAALLQFGVVNNGEAVNPASLIDAYKK